MNGRGWRHKQIVPQAIHNRNGKSRLLFIERPLGPSSWRPGKVLLSCSSGRKVLAPASEAGQSLGGLPGVLFAGELVHEVGHLCCPNLVPRLGGCLERCWSLVCVRRQKEPEFDMKDRSNRHRIPTAFLPLNFFVLVPPWGKAPPVWGRAFFLG